ncbi:hypothetical protein [Pseudoalteromonas sp. T1lg75]|uniref:hypothetical protein n=1 Tax=Pseudoalteromonas sp. T1lg75 TaxID=2077102 RepID=UPI00131A3B3E|nr:hypothetical protein [Pseudoalteromonas sp. T1lg75]
MPPIAVGEVLNVTALENQHGDAFEDPATLELLLYVNGMTAKEIARASIEKIDVQCLTAGRVAYVADISGMPIIISHLVAVPRLRDYPYPIWLDYDGASTERLPVKEGSVSVIDIEQGGITKIEFIAEESILTERLSRHCGQ